MADILLQTVAGEWNLALADLGVSWGRTVVVVGAEADILAESLLLADSPPLAAAKADVALLGDVPADVAADPGTAEALTLADGSADLLVARHAWSGPAGVAPVAAEARRVVRSGGIIVLAELDLPRLVRSAPSQYPAALLTLAMPSLAASLERRTALHSHLETELVRLSAAGVASGRYDLTRGVFADRREHQAAVVAGMWRGTPDCSADEREALGELVLTLGEGAPVVDKEPWVLTRGIVR